MDQSEDKVFYQLGRVGEKDWNPVDFSMNVHYNNYYAEPSSCVDNLTPIGAETSQNSVDFTINLSNTGNDLYAEPFGSTNKSTPLGAETVQLSRKEMDSLQQEEEEKIFTVPSNMVTKKELAQAEEKWKRMAKTKRFKFDTGMNRSRSTNTHKVVLEDSSNSRNPTKYEVKQQKRKERYRRLSPTERYLFNYRNRYHVDPRKSELTKEEEGKIKKVKTRNSMDIWQRRQNEKFGEQEDSEKSANEGEKEIEASGNLENDPLSLESDEPKTLNDLLIRKNARNPSGSDPYFSRKLKYPPRTPEERRLKHEEQRRKKYRESKTEIHAPHAREAILQESETARRAVMKEEGGLTKSVNERDAAPHEQATGDSQENFGYVYTQL